LAKITRRTPPFIILTNPASKALCIYNVSVAIAPKTARRIVRDVTASQRQDENVLP
jgi:hypothetical protein